MYRLTAVKAVLVTIWAACTTADKVFKFKFSGSDVEMPCFAPLGLGDGSYDTVVTYNWVRDSKNISQYRIRHLHNHRLTTEHE